jgi:hypothetical protein
VDEVELVLLVVVVRSTDDYATIENLALTAEPAEPRLAILCVPRY